MHKSKAAITLAGKAVDLHQGNWWRLHHATLVEIFVFASQRRCARFRVSIRCGNAGDGSDMLDELAYRPVAWVKGPAQCDPLGMADLLSSSHAFLLQNRDFKFTKL